MADLVKVSSKSQVSAVAGSIARIIRRDKHVEVQAIGVKAVNHAIMAITLARRYLAQDRIDLAVVPSFLVLELTDKETTALRFSVFRRPDTLVVPHPAEEGLPARHN